MGAIILILNLAFGLGILFFLFYICDLKNIYKNIFNPYFVIVLVACFSRVFFLKSIDRIGDLNFFIAWADNLYKYGLSNFYELKIFKDYPPGYMYVLYILDAIKNIFKLSRTDFKILLKIPAILSDVLTGVLIYKLSKNDIGEKAGFGFACIYVLNPAIIFDSSIWGQIDSVYTLFIFLGIYFIGYKKYLYSFILFLLSIFIKPQALIFSPVFIYAFYEFIKQNKFNKKNFGLLVKYILCLFLVCILILAPFSKNFNFMPIINTYKKTLESYNYAVLNAFNLYMYLGLNLFELNSPIFYFIEFATILFISLFGFWFLFKSKSKAKYFFCAGLLNALVFVFSFKMHERYIYSTLLFFLISYIYHRDKKNLLLYTGFSLSLFVNLFMIYEKQKLFSVTGQIFSLINVILAVSSIYFAKNNFLIFLEDKAVKKKFSNKCFEITPAQNILPTKKLCIMTKKDWLIVLVISFFYGILAFYNLGDIKAPQSFFLANKNDEVIVDFGSIKNINCVQVLNGVRDNKSFFLLSSQDRLNWHFEKNIKLEGMASVFRWQKNNLNIKTRYLKIKFLDDNFYVQEMAFRDKNNKLLKINLVSERGKELFDEQDLVPEEANYKNSMYFDEAYHARTAYEFLHKLKIYETTHPPLGKNIIALGIKIFGMTPFGYRFFGTLCGVVMLPVFYILAKKIFDESKWAIFSTLLFAFDFMHFEQTRIATIDSYTVLFIMLMFIEIYIYYNQNFFDMDFKKNIKPLFMCAIYSGLACSVKWQGFYALSGLAIIFFTNLFFRYREYLYAVKTNKTEIKDKFIILSSKTVNLSILFMIIVFLPIYFASYFLYIRTDGANGFSDILQNQDHMYSYHMYLKATHAFSSRWWQWILNLRPILFYSKNYLDKVAGISCFTNPVICYGGLIGFFYCLSKISRRFDRKIFFLLIGYLSMLCPWIFIKRPCFAYHYFPCVPFLILMLTYWIKDYLHIKYGKKILLVFVSSAAILFIMFYPVISGLPVSQFYIDKFLKWFVSWQLH